MRIAITLIAILPLMSLSALSAGEVYRTVDEEGNVTYTDVPPEGNIRSQRVEIPPPPSEERLRQSEQRNREILRAAQKAKLDREEQRSQRKSRVAAAEKELTEAEARLQQTKVIQDEDRQNLAAGRRRIHPDYFERVKKAEAEVEAARKALREARGY